MLLEEIRGRKEEADVNLIFLLLHIELPSEHLDRHLGLFEQLRCIDQH